MNSESLDSQFSSIVPRIEFLHVQDQYSHSENLICKYCLIDYEVQEGDRIAIFKLGWQYVKDYVLFEWVPKDPDENVVVFNKLCLPKNTIEIYQFCFISGENNVHGASEPFQFCDRPKNYRSLFQNSTYKKSMSATENYKSLVSASPLTSLGITDVLDKDGEMTKLKEENDLLRNTLKMIVANKKSKNTDSEIEMLKKITYDLQSTLHIQQLQIKELQLKVSDCTDDCKKLRKEKKELENVCGDLKKKFEKGTGIGKLSNNFDVLGELESIPPFPFAK